MRDEGRTHAGHHEIRSWLATAGRQFTYTRTPLGAERQADAAWIVRNRLDGNFPGGTEIRGYQGYYGQIQRRSRDLIAAHYSPDRAELREFIQRYHVTHFLINRQAFLPLYVGSSRWIQEIQPEGQTALDVVSAGVVPVLARLTPRCQAFSGDRYVLVDAACVASATVGSGESVN